MPGSFLTSNQLGMLSNGDYDEDLTPKQDHIYNGQQFKSSAISSATYDGRGNMKVKYRNGKKTYDFPCDDDEWKALKAAPSKGKFMYYEAKRY